MLDKTEDQIFQEKYDMALSQERKAIAQDLHHNMDNIISKFFGEDIEIGESYVSDMEEVIYNEVAEIGALNREIGKEEITQAISDVTIMYRTKVDRNSTEQSLDSIDDLKSEYGQENMNLDL